VDDGRGVVTEFRIPGGARAPLSARAKLTESLEERFARCLVDDLRLLVSELVTNCVLHGGVGEAAEITVRARLRADAVRTEVCHDGPRFDAPADDPDLGSPGGFGLLLVDRMASSWGIGGRCQTCVWFELGLAA
jgi:sigma-B regulation protein RsbU (phosphoserine phosphatase)